MRPALRGWHPEAEFRELLEELRGLFQRGPNLERRLLMALDARVQKLIDEVAETRGLKDSVAKGFELLSKQIADLKDQLGSIVPGQAIDAENAAAIQKAVDDLDQTNTALQEAIPAEPVPVPEPTPEELAAKGITQPATHDTAGNPIEAPKP